MLNAIIRFSLTNRLLVISVAALLLVYGGFSLTTLPVDVFPNLNRPTVTIFTEAEGLAPEEVETLVTLPIETAINGATGVERVRSASGIGFSIVWAEFGWKTDVYTARQLITEKLQQTANRLPQTAKPVLAPISSLMGEIMLVGLTSDNPQVNSMELRTIADWDIRQRLLALPGVSQITVIGGDVKQYQVLISPHALNAHHVTLHEVQEAIQNTSVNSTGGFLLHGYQESLIRNLARIGSIDDLASTVIPKDTKGQPALTLRQIAEVRLGGPLGKRGDAGVNGQPAVMLSIQKQPDADTIKLTRAVEQELAKIQAHLPQGVTVHDDIFRQSRFIERAVDNVVEALRDGAILVAVVLFLFLLNFRTTFITLTAIPLSFVVTALVFKWFGLSINTMTLGGLAIAIGELVDDAIVDVENVFRRLRENRRLPEPKPVMGVIFEASSEVRSSIVFATIIVVLVFIPLFAMQGVEGRIFAPLGVAYIVSILASLLVSLTVTPALCSYLLPQMPQMREERDTWLVIRIKDGVTRLLDACFAHARPVLMAVAGAFLLSALSVFFMGREFLPPFNEGSATVNVLSAPGTSLDESNRIGVIAEKLLLEVPEIKKTGRRVGRAEQDEHAEGIHSNEIEVEFAESDRNREAILHDMRARLEQIPGVATNIGQPISHRIDHMLSGVRAQIAVKLFGPDLQTLRMKADAIQAVMADIPGIVDLSVEKQVLIPQLHVRIDRESAVHYGVMAGELARHAELALQGEPVAQVIDGPRLFNIILRMEDEARNSPEAIRQIPVETLSGVPVPLGLVADVEEAKGPNIINRENVQRRIVIQANVSGADLVGTVAKLQQAIADKVDLPQGYFIAYGGQFESQASASRLIAILSLFSLAGMLLVLFSHFKSINLALQVMLSIPLAFIGAVLGVWLSGGVFSIATLVGFVTLTGIAARNGIMMIAHYLHLMELEGERFTREMIYRGTRERLIPVLMTASTASLALIPLILAADEPGREILHPVAVVIFSGLFSSTLLDIAVRPLIFWRYGRSAVAGRIPHAV